MDFSHSNSHFTRQDSFNFYLKRAEQKILITARWSSKMTLEAGILFGSVFSWESLY